MKISDLISILSKEELSAFKIVIKNHKRKRLGLLFNWLKKHPKPDKEALFEHLFNESYHEKKDYLLRNESRLLKEEIETFLVIRQLEKKWNSGDLSLVPHLLSFYLERGEFELFEKESRRYEKLAEKERNLDVLREIAVMQFNYVHQNMETHLDVFTKLDQLLDKEHQYLSSYSAEQIQTIILKKAFLSLNFKSMQDNAKEVKIPKNPFREEDLADPLMLNFLKLRADSYLLQGEEKIRTYEKILELTPEVSKYQNGIINSIPGVLTMLGLSYFMKGDFVKAEDYYLQAIAKMEELKHPLNLEVIFNYFTNTLAQSNFEDAIIIWKNYQKEITNSSKLFYRFQLLTCLAYIMTGDLKAANELVIQDIGQRPKQDYYYIRHINAIIHFEENDLELCDRELNNILQTIYYKSPQEEKNRVMTKFFKKLVNICQNALDKKSRTEQLQLLQTELVEKLNDPVRFFVILGQWLNREINNRLSV